MRNHLFIFLFCICLFAEVKAQGYGLLFKSTEVGVEARTGLNLTPDEEIAFRNRFSLLFDISFRNNPIHFGTIFQLKEKATGKVLALNCNMFDEGRELVFTLNGQPTGLMAGMPKGMKDYYNRWHRMKVVLDANEQMLHLSIDSVHTYSATFPFSDEAELSIVFGVDQANKQLIPESPYFSLKDVMLHNEHDEVIHHWPLEQGKGRLSPDVVGGWEALVYNPEWVRQYHNQWQEVETFELEAGPQIAFCQQTQQVVLLYPSFYYTYDLVTRQMKKIPYGKVSPVGSEFTQNVMCHDGEILVYDHMSPFVARFNLSTYRWDSTYVSPAIPTAFHHHNKLIHPNTEALTTIGGYGYFKYTNLIQSYDKDKKQWMPLSLKGDTISPRYLAGLGKSGSDDTYYLFGGLGNEEGNQMLGQQYAYDLYNIDFGQQSVKKVWEIPSDQVSKTFTPVNSLVIPEGEDCFYTLVFDQQDYFTSLSLLKGSLSQPEFQLIGDSIPYYFKDVDSYADLFYWEGANQLLAITLHNQKDGRAKVGLYTMLFPPVEGVFVESAGSDVNAIHWMVVLAIGIVLVMLGAFVIRSQFKKGTNSGVKRKNHETHESTFVSYPEQNRINLFGGFQVIDRSGKDITDRFSPTVKELFLLVYTHSINGKDGVSSNGIHKTLWPDKEEVRAKNNRGVNVGRLRSVLNELDGISLEYSQAKWRLVYNEEVFSDLDAAKKIMQEAENSLSAYETVSQLLPLLKRGKLLPCITKEWLSIFKEQETSLVIEHLEHLLQSEALSDRYDALIELAETIFKFDQLNDSALKYYCQSFHKKGKHGIAWEAYQRFIKHYQETYNESYPVDFKTLVK